MREQDHKRAVAVADATDDSKIQPGTRVRFQLSKTKQAQRAGFLRHMSTAGLLRFMWCSSVLGLTASLSMCRLAKSKCGPYTVFSWFLSAQRIEARSISPEEVAAAQAAPAGSRPGTSVVAASGMEGM